MLWSLRVPIRKMEGESRRACLRDRGIQNQRREGSVGRAALEGIFEGNTIIAGVESGSGKREGERAQMSWMRDRPYSQC